jgi:hypothetical protein
MMALRPVAGSPAALSRAVSAEDHRRRGQISVANITMTSGGQVDVIVDNYLGGSSAAVSEPYDPAWFRPDFNPRLAVCNILSTYAVARCARGRGYF